ncbi:MAG: DegT/DnrJ/EryC1/StrS family aminotransferase, partial [Daejeonella sp.]|nr:DegT/DnrJ/EryC1/StrS family aminotransferase [Daejeonella sp.]
MKRRNVIKGLTLLPFAGTVLRNQSVQANTQVAGSNNIIETSTSKSANSAFMDEANIFRSIGVEPVINCMGTFTIIGGSLERPSVRAAMEAAAHNFVQYDELADGIGQRLADLTGAEWGMVSAGCAAGLKHITAACVTGGNPEKLIRIPDLSGFDKNEVIIPDFSRNAYDHAIRNIGVKIVSVKTPDELRKAINPRTAMIYIRSTDTDTFTGQPLSLEVISQIAKPHQVPVLIDAA